MKQKCIVNLVVEKGIEISQVQDWINEKITNSKEVEIKLYNAELIFDGSLNSFLGDLDVLSPAGLSKVELKKLFKSRPWFIHQFSLKNQPSDKGEIYMTKKTAQCAIPKQYHVIDDTELNQLMANFPTKIAKEIAQESTGYVCSDDLDDLEDDKYYHFSFRRLGWR